MDLIKIKTFCASKDTIKKVKTDNSTMTAGVWGRGGYRGITGDGRRLDLRWWTHNVVHR